MFGIVMGNPSTPAIYAGNIEVVDGMGDHRIGVITSIGDDEKH